MSDTIEKVSIIISKGSLEGIYPGLIMANGARMEGIEANLFFTFFGLDAINKAKHEHVKVATVGNPGLHLATWAGGVPGMSALVTHQLAAEMEKLDIPPIPEFVEMIADSGAGLYACKASVDLFKLSQRRLHTPGARHHHRRGVLRPGRRRTDHLHLSQHIPSLPGFRVGGSSARHGAGVGSGLPFGTYPHPHELVDVDPTPGVRLCCAYATFVTRSGATVHLHSFGKQTCSAGTP